MSFEIALSGLNAVHNQLDTISNNIANASTAGYRSARANFSATYAGTQPTGVEVSSVTQNMDGSTGVLSTGRSLDAAIHGKGYFITHDPVGSVSYTRVGMFATDKEGYLVDNTDRRVQGYGNASSSDALGTLGDIKVPTGQLPAKASDQLKYAGNLSDDWKDVKNSTFSASDPNSYSSSATSILFDSRGKEHTLTQYFVKKSGDEVQVHFTVNGAPNDAVATLTFTREGQLDQHSDTTVKWEAAPGVNAEVKLDYTGTTRFSGATTTNINSANGYSAGVMTGVRLEKSGEVTALYNNGQSQRVATLALANFPNESGLVPISDTSWIESPASGKALVSAIGSRTASQLLTGAVEGSNVDLTRELIGLMGAQRNYQASTKVISTDNMLVQALMQAM